MAKGKYKSRSLKRRAEKASLALSVAEREQQQERQKLDLAESQMAKIQAMIADIERLRKQIQHQEDNERRSLSGEIARLREDLASLEATRAAETKVRDAAIMNTRPTEGAIIGMLEGAFGLVGEEVTLVHGVHASPRLDAEAVRRIQRARGLRG